MQEMEKALLGEKIACQGLKGPEECGQNETFMVAAHVCRDGGAVKQLSGIEEGEIGVYYAVIRHSGFILETIKVFKRENNMLACIRENRFLV